MYAAFHGHSDVLDLLITPNIDLDTQMMVDDHLLFILFNIDGFVNLK